MKTNYFIRLGDSISQFFNVLIFNGDPNYSISGDSYRLNRVWLRIFIDTLLSLFEKDHCFKAYINDVRKAKLLVKETSEIPDFQ